MKEIYDDDVRRTVREGYSKIANEGSCGCSSGGCCGGSDPDKVALAIGYMTEEIADLPDGANMGLSCGNPTAVAALREGEVVMDLGSGGGFDVFIAARKVGSGGRSIGIDMTPDMLSKARQNAAKFSERTGLDNVEFRLGEIEHLPAPDNSVDVIISNCVINLSPRKEQVWREMFRVLRPGGRVAVSDLALKKLLPDALLSSVESLIGCVAGAVLIDETCRMVEAAGFNGIEVELKSDYIDGMTEWNDPLYRSIIEMLPPSETLGDYVTSMYVKAVK